MRVTRKLNGATSTQVSARMPAGTRQDGVSERSGLDETVAHAGAAATLHKEMVTQRTCQPHVARSLMFSGEATRPAFTVKSPNFSVLKVSQDFTSQEFSRSVFVWPDPDLFSKAQPREHLPREHFPGITGSAVHGHYLPLAVCPELCLVLGMRGWSLYARQLPLCTCRV